MFRTITKILKFLYTKLWKEPKDIRGWPWTAALYLAVACLVTLAQQSPSVVLLLLAAHLVMRWQDGKPKRLGRLLPYRRRRG